MFGAKLRWNGDQNRGTIGLDDDMQLLVFQEARSITGCFRMTDLGALAMDSELRPAMENRLRQFGLRLLSPPQGNQVRELVGAASGVRKRLECAFGYSGRTEISVLLEEPESFDADLLQGEEAYDAERAALARVLDTAAR